MKKILIIIVLLTILSIAIVLASSYLTYLLDINIKGFVNVDENTIIKSDIVLYIDREEGSKIYELGTINIPRNMSIQIKRELVNYEEQIKLILGGVLELKSEKENYKITMPCLVNINEQCYRIAAIIPGYDVPLNIASGKYNVSLILTWKASGRGSFYLKLIGVYSDNYYQK